ncbi:MAG TPA: FtsX-like permease family protein [Verrucomicrobiales bacterium]|nr:FtsX-like permease family protein [Verrucomicrobiales bacterium]HIL70220.1 FtsX-like permease family protein [Verrucomicrobiota bacterium]
MSRLPFELMLAVRYLRPKRTFVSTITLISVIGVALGVGVLIIVISVMSGFDQQLQEKLLGFNAHLRVQSRGTPMIDHEKTSQWISKQAGVKGVSPFVMGKVLIETNPVDGSNPRVDAPILRGIHPEFESDISTLPESVKWGSPDVSGNGLLVGVQLALALNIKIGDTLNVFSTRQAAQFLQNQREGADEAIISEEYVVNGIFDVGYYEYNAAFIACSLWNAQDLYGLDDTVHGLMVMLDDPMQVDKFASRFEESLGPEFKVDTWKAENSDLLEAIQVEKQVMGYLLFFIMIVAAFGITNSLITFVFQKTKEIGLLKALGATNLQVTLVFLIQSLVVGVIGVISGFFFGILALEYRNEFLFFMRKVTGFELFPASIYNFSKLPALIIPSEIAFICGSALLICVLAGVFPAWNAGRLRPVQALHHD